jgi:hypothetical protein
MPISQRTLRPGGTFTPKSIPGLALWLDGADTSSLYTTDAGPVVPVTAPTDIAGCALWLDGADSSAASMTLSGSLVETWKDKSGNGRDFTATSTARPTLTPSAINSRSAVTFAGSLTTMTGNTEAQDVIRNLAGYTIFTAIRTASVAGGERFALGVGTTVLFRIGQQDSRPFMGGRRVHADALEGVTGTASDLSVGAAFIQTASVNHTSQSLTGLRNGATFASDATYMASGSSDNVASPVTVGSQPGSYGFWNGEIAEVIVFNTALSTADRARVEAYLAAKWGISGVHRAARDEIAPVNAPTELAGCAMWIDASDDASVARVGGLVDSVADKSGNGRNMTFEDSRPLYPANAIGGRPAIQGTGTQFLVAGGASIASPSITVFAVYKLDEWQTGVAPLDKNRNLFHTDLPTSGFSSVGYRWENGSNTATARFGDADSSAPYASGHPVGSLEPQIHTGRLDSSALVAMSRTSGVAGSNGAVSSIHWPATFGSRVVLMTGFGTGPGYLDRRLVGCVGEFIIFNRALNDVEISRVEKYLAAKWGISGVPDPTPPVGYWADKSGNARHATQAMGAVRPTVAAASLNSRGTVAFTGASSQRLGATVPGTDGQLYTVLAVVRNATSANGVLMGERGGNFTNALHFQTANNRLTMYIQRNEPLYGPHGGAAVIYGYSKDSTTLVRGYQNGARVISDDGAVVTGLNLANLLRNIGSSTAGASAFTGNIAELIAYPSSLSAGDRKRLERYLAAKWGIALAPQVSNADAQDWINRVYANGGTVSASTAAAVNQFCNDIENGSLRDRFYRLNLLCGTGINACLVPLYRGQSLGGAQFGGATDLNNGPFVSGDYIESGSLGGLWYGGAAATNTSKRLDTGLNGSELAPGNRHAAAYEVIPSQTDYSPSVHSGNASATMHGVGPWTTSEGYRYRSQNTIGGSASGTTAGGGFWLGSDTSSTNGTLYRNGAVSGVSGEWPAGGSGNTTYQILGHAAGEWSEARLGGYSVGLSMTAPQVSAYNAAMQSFQRALLRDRPCNDPIFAAVTNEETRLWIDNVYRFAGTVTPATALAVNNFCNEIEAAGIRDRFYRLNLFCGSNLNACRVPLYRGPNSATLLGNPADANNGFVGVGTDYSESVGLTGNGSSKYLNTGLVGSTSGIDRSSCHVAMDLLGYSHPGGSQFMPVSLTDSGATDRFWIATNSYTANTEVNSTMGSTPAVLKQVAATNGAAIAGGLWTASRTTLSAFDLYNGSASQASSGSTITAGALPANPMTVFVRWTGSAFYGYAPVTLRGYSIGLGLSQPQVSAYNTAMVNFRAALGRT